MKALFYSLAILLLASFVQAEELEEFHELEALSPAELVYKHGPPLKETELQYCEIIGEWISFILELDFTLEASGPQNNGQELRQNAATAAGLEPLITSPLGLGQIGVFDLWLRNKFALMALFTSKNNSVYCLYLGT